MVRNAWAKQTGFTIVELLIVIVVIAILAAITVVSYTGITSQANDTAIKSDLANLTKKLQVYYASNGDVYPNGDSQMAGVGFSASKGSYSTGVNGNGNLTYCGVYQGAAARFVVLAKSTSGKVFMSSSFGGGITEYTNTYNGAHGTVCPLVGIATSEANYAQSQGYNAPNWGSPGWKVWTGA